MHAVARLVLHPEIRNIQTSWVKMGASGAALCLRAGANDLGGTLLNESITRAAGGVNGQEFDAASRARLITSLGRRPRTTMYGTPAMRRLETLADLSAGVLNEYSFERGGSQWRGA